MQVLAFHIVITAYGFWLPNDPRGSGSHFIGSKDLLKHGPATHVNSEQSVAGKLHDKNARRAAKKDLKHPAVRFTGIQARSIARAFGQFSRENQITFHALSILPDHIHAVVLRHPKLSAEQMITRLKIAASKHLREKGQHPFQNHPDENNRLPKIFARDARHRFLYTQQHIEDRINYVDNNPVKHGFKPQHWSFLTPSKS